MLFPLSDQRNMTAESGQKNATLPCRAPNNNTIVIVEWSRADLGEKYVLLYRDGQFLSDDQHPSFMNRVDLQDRKMNNGDVSLVLKNVTTADDGSYNCNIFNKETRSWESINTVSLTVSGHTGPSVGLIAGLSVSAAAVLLVAAVVGFVCYRKHERQKRDFN